MKQQQKNISLPSSVTSVEKLKSAKARQFAHGLATVLFGLAQMYAINSGTEEITEELLQKVYDRSFVFNQEFLEAIRSGKFSQLRDMPDLLSDSQIKRLSVAAFMHNAPGKESDQDNVEGEIENQEPEGSSAKQIDLALAKKPRRKEGDEYPAGTLMRLVQDAKPKGAGAYDTLKAAGLIGCTP